MKLKTKFKLKVTLQIAPRISCLDLPTARDFSQWTKAALQAELSPPIESISTSCNFAFTIRLVGKKESAALNLKYRKKSGPTNILSFSYELLENLGLPFYGDLVICIPVMREEARRSHKTIFEHCKHLTIHGILHLLGFEHNTEKNARVMEDLEEKIMSNI